MSENRIVGGKADISYSSVDTFFEERGKSGLKHKYNYVMYLDETPEVAVQRDRQAKTKVEELLDIREGMTVLDLGCGIGRWGELFCRKGAYYIGVDSSAKMIEMAQENLRDYQNKKLLVCNLRDLDDALRIIGNEGAFKCDIVFFCGVLMYLNDADVKAVLGKIPDVINADCRICFIESMAEGSRLTLKDIYSQELKQNYSAIYRTAEEFRQLMAEAFGGKIVFLQDELLDFEDGLQKKREHVTMEHCMLWGAVD